jgi:Fe-S-cluster-containing dehydrogenase component/formate-dependent nitrite reductase membrane component NrfD
LKYGFVIDQSSCIGCHACTVACKTEHDVPLGVDRTWVKYVEKGSWPDTKRFFSVMRCNHCEDAPCVSICPTSALHTRDDGIVDFDTASCIGCKSCMQACPYDALYIDPQDNTAQKCNYCVHRVEVGLEPACVVVCPEQAIIAGDLDNPESKIARMVATDKLFQRAPEQGTRPKLWYKGVESANIDPLGATDPGDGGIWRDPASSWLAVDLTPPTVTAETASVTPSQPAARIVVEGDAPPRIVYGKEQSMPWGWRVSSYFLTKGIAAGLTIALALALLLGADTTAGWARWGTPLVAGLFLGLTGGLLVWDLKRPDRFYYLLTKGNPSSWLVKGAWILSAYGGVLGIWFLLGVFGVDGPIPALIWIAAVLGLGVAGYTAFLFAQAEGRDLWQSPLLLWHMVAGAFAAGGGAGLYLSLLVDVGDTFERAFGWAMVGGAAVLGLLAFAEIVTKHPTRNISEAVHHMTRGVYAREWWLGGQLLGVAIPIVLGALYLGGAELWVGALGGVAAAAGVWFADDAFVKAGQSVPLA